MAPRWTEDFLVLWRLPLWIQTSATLLNESPTEYHLARCRSYEAVMQAHRHLRTHPSHFECCPDPSYPPTYDPRINPTPVQLSTISLKLYSFEFWGPCGTVAHSLYAGACDRCRAVHWMPHRLLAAPWKPEDYLDSSRPNPPAWIRA